MFPLTLILSMYDVPLDPNVKGNKLPSSYKLLRLFFEIFHFVSHMILICLCDPSQILRKHLQKTHGWYGEWETEETLKREPRLV